MKLWKRPAMTFANANQVSAYIQAAAWSLCDGDDYR